MSDTDIKDTIEYKMGTMPNMPVIIHTQYVKDFSFENPHAPNSLRAGQPEKPKLDVNIMIDAQKIEDEQLKSLYEVVMTVRAQSMRGERVDFIVEMAYGAAVSLPDVPEDKHQPLLFIEIPRQIFPYIRHGIAQITQGGGYPPLFLNPVDFQAMYAARFARQNEPSAGNA